MKIALCVSGHLRDCDRTSLSFHSFRKRLNDFAETETFVSTWNKRNISRSWSGNKGIINNETKDEHITEEYVKETYETNDVSIFDQGFYNSEFSPFNYRDLTDKINNWHPHGVSGNVIHSSNMFFIMWQSNVLKKTKEFKNGQKYDLVIRVRPDFEFYTNVSLDIIKNHEKNILYIPKHLMFDEGGQVDLKINDWVAFGDSDIMNKYFSSFLKFSAIFNQNVWGPPEEVMYRTHEDFFAIEKKEFDMIGALSRDFGNIRLFQREPLDAQKQGVDISSFE